MGTCCACYALCVEAGCWRPVPMSMCKCPVLGRVWRVLCAGAGADGVGKCQVHDNVCCKPVGLRWIEPCKWSHSVWCCRGVGQAVVAVPICRASGGGAHLKGMPIWKAVGDSAVIKGRECRCGGPMGRGARMEGRSRRRCPCGLRAVTAPMWQIDDSGADVADRCW